MKNLPGVKIVGFFAVVMIVGLGVYAWAQGNEKAPLKHNMFVVKFGWEGKEAGDLDCVNRSPKEIKDYLGNDPKRYKIRHYLNGEIQTETDEGGVLGDCSEAAPSPTPTATPTSAAGATEASPSGTPKGAKTQTAGVAAFYTAQQAENFLKFLSTTPTPTPSPQPTKGKK